MKEAFEKSIEILEVELHLADKEKERCARENQLQFDSAKGYANGIANAIEIVKQVTEVYGNDGWILVSNHLPEIEEYYKPYWVTILTQDSRKKDFYYVRKVTWNQYDKRWEEDCGKPVSDKINIVAWREYDLPEPYRPKGE